MAERSARPQTALHKDFDVPVQMRDVSMFDDEFSFMKQRFASEMRRIEEEMVKFSTQLLNLSGVASTVQEGVKTEEEPATSWDVITKSPLVENEGDQKTLNLQFDVSQFEPGEVSVKILNDILLVSATHEENTDTRTVYREFTREFQLPPGTDPEAVESSIDKDGVLSVKAPLPEPELGTKKCCFLK